MKEKTKSDEGKIEYLQMIQNAISRMSTSSALFKGFSATIVAGISMISYCQQKTMVIILSFLPVVLFAILDTYYLQLEKRLRHLYDLVREGTHACDFNMKLNDEEVKDRKAAELRVIDCIKSFSIWPFYLTMILVLVTVVILKWKGLL